MESCVALTGASGHLGRVLAEELLRRGRHLRLLIHHSIPEGLDLRKVEVIQGSVLDPECLHRLTQGVDVLIHCAARISLQGDPDGMVHRVNVEGTRLVLEAARLNKVSRVLHISSIHAFDPSPQHEPLNENRALCPPDSFAYDRSKRKAHELALAFAQEGLNVTILCPTSLIGPPDYGPSPQGKALLDVSRGRVPAVFPGGYDFLDIRDAAASIINAIEVGDRGEVYLLSGEFVTVKDLIIWTQEWLGQSRWLPTLPFWCGYAMLPFLRLGGRLSKRPPALTYEMLKILEEGCRQVDSSKARRALGLKPRPIRQSVADTLQWFKENGYLCFS
jgi:dihydroflavonol-4-reductase